MTDSPKVAVFGCTGFIGSYMLKELSINSNPTNVLVRKNSIHKLPKVKNNKIIKGELTELESIKSTIKDCNIIIYAIGIIREYKSSGITFDKLHFEYFKNIVDLAKEIGIDRIIYISSNGAKQYGTKYQSSKYKAEQYLAENIDNWTIYRPSVVFGDPDGRAEFVTQLRDDIIQKNIPAPLFFRLNPFSYKQFFKSNPVHVEDLVKLVVRGLESDKTNLQIFPVGGARQTSWESILKTIDKKLNRKKIFLPVPIIIIQTLAKLFDRFEFFPITYDQIVMLKEDNICLSDKIFKEFEIVPKDFSFDNLNYIKK